MKFRLEERKKHILMLVLLIILTILARLHNDYQTDFDSYWLHAQAESIQIHGSALWVFDPVSLTGYYPLSYPSGTMFFLATASTMTGLDMNTTVFLTSILVGLLIVFFTLLLATKVSKSWIAGYTAACIVSLSPMFITYTSFNASARVLILVFVLPMILSLIQWKESGKKRYLVLALILFLLSILTHRTSQFIAVFLIAFVLAFILEKIPVMWNYLQSHKIFHKTVKKRYQKRYVLLVDIFILMGVLLVFKITDLIIRGRLATNLDSRIIEPGERFLISATQHWEIVAIVIVALIVLATLLILLWKKREKNLRKTTKNYITYHYHNMFEKPQNYLPIALIIIATIVFIRQFFGASFYSPSLNEFYSSELISGRSPLVAFINFIINYTTSVSLLFILFFVGFVVLLLKKNKEFTDWFMIFSFIGFVGTLLDRQYTRLFLVPFFAIFITLGITTLFKWFHGFSAKKRNIFSFLLVLLITFSLTFGMFMPLIREQIFEETEYFAYHEPYWEAGQYLRTLDCQCSTITTDEMVAGVTLFASSGVPGGSHNIYYFVDESLLQPDRMSISEIIDNIEHGRKMQSFYYLHDWIFGGQYYVGRHTLYLSARPFTDRVTHRILDDYNVEYYNHDKMLRSNAFHDSIQPVKNIVYDNNQLVMYDLTKGRDS